MELNFENKYKDRAPEETCAIIKDFFLKRGYQLYCYPTVSDIGTYSYCIFIEYNNQLVLTANGKGATDEFALASGLAELYERFCNYGYLCYNNIFMDKVMLNNKTNFNYYLAKNEKILQVEDILNNAIFNDYFTCLTHNNLIHMNNFIRYICGSNIIGIPYENILNPKDIAYLDPRILVRVVGSTGMAAGNSFKEAFVQGFSEILERYIVKQFVLGKFTNYSFLNLSNYPQFDKYLRVIESQSKEFYIIDASAQYDIPVVIGLMIDKQGHWTRLNFASFPNIEIAIERLFTEMYQNAQTMYNQHDYLQIPYDNTNAEYVLLKNSGSLSKMSFFPEDILNSTFQYQEPTSIWLKGTHNSIDVLYDYYLNLIEKLKLNVYVHNHSLSTKMSAIQIFVNNIEFKMHTNWDRIIRNPDFNIVYEQLKVFDALYHWQNIIPEMSDYFYTMNSLFEIGNGSSLITSILGGRDLSNPLGRTGFITNDLRFLQDIVCTTQDDLKQFAQTIFYEKMQKYVVLSRYIENGYSDEKLSQVMTFLGIQYTPEDKINYNNPKYLFYKIFLETFIEYINSNEYENIAKTFSQFDF